MGTGLKPLNHFRLKAVLRLGRLVGILTYYLALLASWRFNLFRGRGRGRGRWARPYALLPPLLSLSTKR